MNHLIAFYAVLNTFKIIKRLVICLLENNETNQLNKFVSVNLNPFGYIFIFQLTYHYIYSYLNKFEFNQSTNLNALFVISISVLLIPKFFATVRQFAISFNNSSKILFAVSTFI